MQKALLLALAAWALQVPCAAIAAPRATQASSPKRDLSDLLKAELVAQLSKLGALADWQEKVFNEELLPQYPRFVRDYRPGGSGVVADIDVQGMRSYLAWGPGEAKGDALKVLVFLSLEKDEAKCQEALLPIRKVIKARLERRGFQPLFLESDALGEGKLTGAAQNERLSEQARKKGYAGSLIVQWQLAPVDLDSAHADEKHYQIRVFHFSRPGKGEWKHEGNLEILENDSILQAAERLMSDAVTDFGGRVLEARATKDQGSEGRELKLILTGVRDFAQFRELRGRIQAAVGALGTIQERQFSRGRVEFAVLTQKPAGDIQAAVAPVAGNEVTVKVEGP